MRILNGLIGLSQLPASLAVSIGTYDGVHQGHQALLAELKSVPRTKGTAVFSFASHPRQILFPEIAFTPLMDLTEKTSQLARLGLDFFVVLPAQPELFNLSPFAFWQQLRSTQPAMIIEGSDFRFGKDRAGTINDLQRWSNDAGVRLKIMKEFEILVENQRIPVRSQTIREWLTGERVTDALRLLGHPYALTGIVESGFRQGKRLGFPTANISAITSLIPTDGVYQATTRVNSQTYQVALSIGTRPTFGDSPRLVEAHLIDYNGDLYGSQLTLRIERYLRPQITFKSMTDLIAKIHEDIRIIRGGQSEILS